MFSLKRRTACKHPKCASEAQCPAERMVAHLFKSCIFVHMTYKYFYFKMNDDGRS